MFFDGGIHTPVRCAGLRRFCELPGAVSTDCEGSCKVVGGIVVCKEDTCACVSCAATSLSDDDDDSDSDEYITAVGRAGNNSSAVAAVESSREL